MRFRVLTLCLVGIEAALMSLQCRAADPEGVFRQALGSQEPLYQFPADALCHAVKVSATREPQLAGEFVAMVLRSGRNDADAIAPSLVKAAIEGLGPEPKSSLVAAIVRKAVSTAPSEVLDIVTAAVKASPRAAAPAIVTAAESTAPHPEQIVSVNVQRRAERLAGGSDKQLQDGKSLSKEQKQMTLAEAIIQAALDADPGLLADELTTAANQGLLIASAPQRLPILTEVLAPIPLIPVPSASPTPFSTPGRVSP